MSIPDKRYRAPGCFLFGFLSPIIGAALCFGLNIIFHFLDTDADGGPAEVFGIFFITIIGGAIVGSVIGFILWFVWWVKGRPKRSDI